MNVVSFHDMSKANYLNLNAYTITRSDLWQKVLNLLVDVHSLYKSPKPG